MKSPLKVARTFTEFYRVVEIRVEKFLQLLKNRNGMKIIRMEVTVENFLSGMDRISYDDDLRDVILGAGLVDAAPDGEQFCFSACYKRSMMDGFGEGTIR